MASSTMTFSGNQYSWVDKLIHRFAFSSAQLQRSLIDIDTKLSESQIADLSPSEPVFICGLPRSGTTTLLESLYATNFFATYTYRDMPFVFAPYVWHRVSAAGRKSIEAEERAHGDGIAISIDSPEAFEEVLWKIFWSQTYSENEIRLVGAGAKCPSFERALEDNMRKLVVVRRQAEECVAPNAYGRYLSKNNANIARIDYLLSVFPDAKFVVPFRAPDQHAASLLRQHQRFKKLQSEDPFVFRYMSDIGHFDFGSGLKLINFGGDSVHGNIQEYDQIDAWIDYWMAAYKSLLKIENERVKFFDYDAACERPSVSCLALAKFLGLPEELTGKLAGFFGKPRSHDVTAGKAGEATDLYVRLQSSPNTLAS